MMSKTATMSMFDAREAVDTRSPQKAAGCRGWPEPIIFLVGTAREHRHHVGSVCFGGVACQSGGHRHHLG